MNRFFLFSVSLLLTSFVQAQTTPSPQLGYTYKVDTGVAGKQVYISGQRPFNANGELVGAGDLTAQTRQVFENITAALSRVGMTMGDVKQVTYLLKGASGLVNVSDSQQASSVGTSFFGQAAPGIQDTKSVSLIARDDVLVEVEVIAIKD